MTEIEAINALANYFKHHDEWPADWATATGQSARTIGVITQLGAKQGTGVDLTTGLDQLGGDLRDVGKRIRAWQTNLHSAYTTELQTLGLI